MKLTREQLLGIGSLELSGWLGGLNDALVDKYSDTLSEFVEIFPGIEADLKKALVIGDTAAQAYVLSELSETLANIRADALVRECERLRQGMDAAGPEVFEADLTAFLASAATLSVDILMLQHKNVEVPVPKPPTRRYEVLYTDKKVVAAVSESKQKSILAVDDIPITLNLLRAALTAAGFKFNGVTSGSSALDFISKFRPDLFILDIEMPKMNGFELADRIKKAGHAAPIVFLTGNTTRDYLMRAVKIGAVDFIVKPVNGDTVAEKVRKILGG